MKLVIVYGPPMSGKTTYVNERLTHSDIVYDYDALTAAITCSDYQVYNDNAHDLLLTMRNSMMDYAKWNTEGTMYIITTFLSNTVLNRVKLLEIQAEHVKIGTDISTCLKRLAESSREDKEHIEQVIREWYIKHNTGPASDRVVSKEAMNFYKSRAWRETREIVLRRDNYECQECKKQGKVTTINPEKHKSLDVDHILELETHPELAHDLDNLVTLCISCHNKKHNRYQGYVRKPDKWGDERWD